MLGRLKRRFSRDLGIDLGTANISVFERGRGIVLREPAVVALREGRGGRREILAVGEQARRMAGRVPAGVRVERPMADGVIADRDLAEALLRRCIALVHGRTWGTAPRLVVCAPVGTTPVERRAVRQAARGAGGAEVWTMDEPLAAALGAGLPVAEPSASMIVDVGGGTTEVAVISLGGIVISRSVRCAGDAMNETLRHFLKRRHGLVVGAMEAERAKIEAGSAHRSADCKDCLVKGREVATGLPSARVISGADLRQALAEHLQTILAAVREVLDRCPPELAADLARDGMVLAGGGSLLAGLDLFLAESVRLGVRRAENPAACVALGLGRSLCDIGRFSDLLGQEE